MFPHLPSSWHHLHVDRLTRQQVAAAAATALVLSGILLYSKLRRRISPEEVELQRRTLLAQMGRITDGSIVGIDGTTEDNSEDGVLDLPPAYLASPHILIYRYRVAGVTYECAQDVTSLREHVRNLRVDLPVQVRYDPRNPGNSIVVSEDWNGVQQDADTGTPEMADVQHVHESHSSD